MNENRVGGALVLTVAGLVCACDNGGLTTTHFELANVTVSNADPTDGNGALEPATATVLYTTGVGVQDLDKVTISAHDATGAIDHELEILWVPATGQVQLCQHFWTPTGGATSGSTRCATGTATVCDPAAISVDVDQKAISLNGLVLSDLFGGTATSTLSGVVIWGDPIQDDH